MESVRIYAVNNLDCAACGSGIEHTVSVQPGVEAATYNPISHTLSIQSTQPQAKSYWDSLEMLVKKMEPTITLRQISAKTERIYRFTGIDCPVCAAKVEAALHSDDAVAFAQVDMGNREIHIRTHEPQEEQFITALFAKAKRVEPSLQIHPMREEQQLPIYKQSRFLRILVASLLFIAAMLGKWEPLYFLSYLVAGYDVLGKAAKNLLHGKLFDEYFLMSVATIGALALRQNGEAAAVMLFYLIGEFFQEAAVAKSRRSILKALDLKVDQARLVQGETITLVQTSTVAVGSIIRVLGGEKIPLDGKVVSGSSTLDMQSLTGESLPISVCKDDQVLSGSLNLTGVLDVLVEKPYQQSTSQKIKELVEQSSTKKAATERFITTFARYYTPFVVVSALALTLIPSLLTGMWETWTYRSLVFLVVSCPCALVISVPLSYFSGIGKSATKGILVKGGNYLEAIAKADTIVFDKTGTLTNGSFTLVAVRKNAEGTYSQEYLLDVAASIERQSSHPLARAFSNHPTPYTATEVQEYAGKGMTGTVDGKAIVAGNKALFAQLGIEFRSFDDDQATIHLAVDGIPQASFIIEDLPRTEATGSLTKLRNIGIRNIIMLSGDTPKQAERISNALGLDAWHASLLPHQKQERLLALATEHPDYVYIGDGMNDAPSLAASKVGIALGSHASDVAMESADIVLLKDGLQEIVDLFLISRKTAAIVRQNIAFALTVKALALLLGAFGFASMWLAVMADTGVTILAVLNSLRIHLYRPSR